MTDYPLLPYSTPTYSGPLGLVILGPAPCSGCGTLVWWDGKRWTPEDGTRHICRPPAVPPPAPEVQEAPAPRIIAAVASQYLLTSDDLVGRSRRPDIAEARAVAAYRLWKATDMTQREIGLVLGGRDRSTIAYLLGDR